MNIEQARIAEWGERSTPLAKQLIYVFSIDLHFFVAAATAMNGAGSKLVTQIMERRKNRGTGSTYHVQDEVLIRPVDGIVREVPHGRVQAADDRIDVSTAGAGTLGGRLLLAVDTGGLVSIEYTGTVAMDRDVVTALDACPPGREIPVGSAFVSMRSMTSRAKYRWLMENQLFAFGRVSVLRDEGGERYLPTTYDVYVAG